MIVYPLSGTRENQLLKYELSTPKIHDEIFDEMLNSVHSEEHSFLYYELASRKFHKNFDLKQFEYSHEEEGALSDERRATSFLEEDKKEDKKEEKDEKEDA